MQILGNGNGQIERYVATHHLSTPVIGVSAGTFSIVTISTIDSHWFLLVHGIFWIGLGTLLLAFIFFMAGISKALLPEIRDAYYQKALLPGFESLGILRWTRKFGQVVK